VSVTVQSKITKIPVVVIVMETISLHCGVLVLWKEPQVERCLQHVRLFLWRCVWSRQTSLKKLP